ncbi:major capsid protein [uncultured Mediterranean phage uvMED]|nr:major capsid protein [uncultured Mediterranean phage uvMED]BAQ87013.1 major capsid protein [uncultured Mediterranean phage uvMED]BAQ87069.1 major capsid protein [uncultured Mediterranean phage uvMED]BAR16623.1 major capsid protein [uncultured Mediterranean phage uvMED]
MALSTISTSFIEEFESGVHMAYQRMGSKLRNTVRNRNGVKNKTTFQKIGKGFATTKARHGSIAPMNLEHTNVNVTLEDYFAGEWIDDLDQLRINHDEMMVAQQSGAYALGRKTDDLILAQMTTTTSAHDETSNGITLAWALELMEKFGNNEVPDDGRRFVVVGHEQWSQLMQLDQFSRSEYIPTAELPFSGGMTAKRWLGFMWFAHSGLTGLNGSGAAGTTHKECFAYHADALAHAIGADISSNMQYHNDKDSYFVLNKMQMNSCLIDVEGVFECELKN